MNYKAIFEYLYYSGQIHFSELDKFIAKKWMTKEEAEFLIKDRQDRALRNYETYYRQ